MKVAAILDSVALGSPGQQLADRLLVGYPADGEHRQPRARLTTACLLGGSETPAGEAAGWAEARRKQFGLEVLPDAREAVVGARAALVVRRHPWDAAQHRVVSSVISELAAGSRVFVWGLIAGGPEEARACQDLAKSRGVALSSGTTLPATWRLPPVEVPTGAPLTHGLVLIGGGGDDESLVFGIDAVLALVERRRGGEAGVRGLSRLEGAAVWSAIDADAWLRDLLGAALSRSDTILGDPERDGRTQDVLGGGLLPALAARPLGWILEHADGLRSAVLVLNGALRDANVALVGDAGLRISAQLYRPPAPNEHHYSRLAAVVDDFLAGGSAPHASGRDFERSRVFAACAAGALHGAPEAYSPLRVSAYEAAEALGA